MSVTEHIPLMKAGNTGRNIAVAILYFFLLPLVILVLPFWLLYAIGTNRNGLGDAFANSPLARIPGVGKGGWTAGIAVFVLVFVLLFAVGAALPGGDAPDQSAAPDKLEPTPTPTDSGGQDSMESNGEQLEGIHELYSASLDEQGLTTTVSESGEHIGYGLQNGNVIIYNSDGESRTETFAADYSVTHLIISDEYNKFAIAWMDMDTFGGATLERDEQWAYEYEGLWDIAATPDMNTVAATSSPIEGSGGVGLVVDGENVWLEGFDDATGYAVDIEDSGNGIVVGADFEWSGADRRGTPGVYYFDAEGNVEWVHETEEAVISVAVNEDENIVVAGTDDGKLLAFNRDGELLWENDNGGFVTLSDDGSTIITDNLEEVTAFNIDGGELWSQSVESFGEDIEVSADGSRVIVGGRGAGVATVIENGEVIWSESWDEGPVQVSLSADGQTWSVIVQDNEERISHVHAYRDY